MSRISVTILALAGAITMVQACDPGDVVESSVERDITEDLFSVVDTPQSLSECPGGATNCRTMVGDMERDAYRMVVETFEDAGGRHCQGIALGLDYFFNAGRVRVFDNRITVGTQTRGAAWLPGENTVAVWSEILNYAESGNSWTAAELLGTLGEEGDHAWNGHLHDGPSGFPDPHFLRLRNPSLACEGGDDDTL